MLHYWLAVVGWSQKVVALQTLSQLPNTCRLSLVYRTVNETRVMIRAHGFIFPTLATLSGVPSHTSGHGIDTSIIMLPVGPRVSQYSGINQVGAACQAFCVINLQF